MRDPYDAAETVRLAILELEKTHSRGDLAAMAGVSRTVMSDFLNRRDKQQQIGMDKLTSLARALKTPASALFSVAPKAGSVTGVVKGVREVPGDNGAPTTETRLVELEAQNRILSEKIRTYEDGYAEVLGAFESLLRRYREAGGEDRAAEEPPPKRRRRS